MKKKVFVRLENEFNFIFAKDFFRMPWFTRFVICPEAKVQRMIIPIRQILSKLKSLV